jgi:multisubunit Na+/H+ antiporter MnhF subunit
MSLITELRKYKIYDMAIFDFTLTFIASLIISKYFNKNILPTFIILIILGIVIHKIIGQPTMLNAYLGLNTKEEVYKNRKLQ